MGKNWISKHWINFLIIFGQLNHHYQIFNGNILCRINEWMNEKILNFRKKFSIKNFSVLTWNRSGHLMIIEIKNEKMENFLLLPFLIFQCWWSLSMMMIMINIDICINRKNDKKRRNEWRKLNVKKNDLNL